jgi:hypothetical protein
MSNIKIIVAAFILSATPVMGRELNNQERLTLVPLKKTLEVKKVVEEQIPVRSLSFGEYLRFNILKKSCVPLNELIKKIEKEVATYPDQSKNIITLYAACSEGVLSLTHMYLNKNYGLIEGDSTY